MLSSCFGINWLTRACFEAWKLFKDHACHVWRLFLKMIWNWVWVKHPWALISQIELWTMLFYVFLNVIQKMCPRGSVLMLLNLVFGLEVQSGFSRFCTSARAEEVPFKRRIRASSISALFYSPLERRIGCASEVRSHARAGVERRFHPSSTFTIRSSGKIDARACTLVSCPLERDSVF